MIIIIIVIYTSSGWVILFIAAADPCAVFLYLSDSLGMMAAVAARDQTQVVGYKQLTKDEHYFHDAPTQFPTV